MRPIVKSRDVLPGLQEGAGARVRGSGDISAPDPSEAIRRASRGLLGGTPNQTHVFVLDATKL
jgi:hypothetical protein